MFCPSCGSPNPDNAKFCKKCGAALSGAPQDTQPSRPQGSRPAGPQAAPGAPAPKPGLPLFAKILIPVCCAAAAVAVVFGVLALRSKKDAPVPSEDIAIASESETPDAVQTPSALPETEPEGSGGTEQGGAPAEEPSAETHSGTVVRALARPSFFAEIKEAVSEVAAAPSAESYTIEPGLKNVINVDDLYVPDKAKAELEQDGFYVTLGSGASEFYEIYEQNRPSLNAS